ncbi:MAG: FixH family protein [Tepidisphaeraceae bacterium]
MQGSIQQPPTTPAKKGRWWIWPTIVVSLLVLHTGGMLVAMGIANRDPTFRVEPDYYKEGLTFDQRKAAMAASEKLGWTVSIDLADAVDATRHRPLIVTLLDHEKKPISGATITLRFFRHANGKAARVLTLTDQNDGVYAGSSDLVDGGFWQFDVTVTKDKDTFVKTIDGQWVKDL